MRQKEIFGHSKRSLSGVSRGRLWALISTKVSVLQNEDETNSIRDVRNKYS
jgi:hypothetical protein